jgi:tetratricopeptide (TPR) repeat protein
VNRNKYIIAAIGLAAGFAISFFWTQSFNRNNATPTTTAASSGMSGGAGGQQAMMGQVQQVIDKAKSNPNDFGAQVEAAKIFNQVGRIAETVDYLKKAYAIDPDKFNQLGAAGFMGQYYFDQKDYAESETWFNRAIKAEPNEADLYVELAATYINREPPRPDQAIDELQRALKVDPKSGHALGHLIEAYALKKDARAAEQTLSQLKQTDPTNQRITSLESMVADLKAGKPVSIPKE